CSPHDDYHRRCADGDRYMHVGYHPRLRQGTDWRRPISATKGDAAALCLPECRRSGEHDRICELPGISGRLDGDLCTRLRIGDKRTSEECFCEGVLLANRLAILVWADGAD